MCFQNWTASQLLLFVRWKIAIVLDFLTNFSCRSDQIQSSKKVPFPLSPHLFVHITSNKLT